MLPEWRRHSVLNAERSQREKIKVDVRIDRMRVLYG